MICAKRRSPRKSALHWAMRGLDYELCSPPAETSGAFQMRPPALQVVTERSQQFRFIVSKLGFLACFWLCFERLASCLVEHLEELRLTSVMHSVEPKPLARLSGITICSENGCRQQLWGKEATLMVSFLIAFLHQPSCFNGDGMVYLRFLVEKYFSEDACLLKCWAYAAELHQVGWMEPRCHLVIFNRTRLVRLQPPLTDSAKRRWVGMVSMATVDSERERESQWKPHLTLCAHT